MKNKLLDFFRYLDLEEQFHYRGHYITGINEAFTLDTRYLSNIVPNFPTQIDVPVITNSYKKEVLLE